MFDPPPFDDDADSDMPSPAFAVSPPVSAGTSGWTANEGGRGRQKGPTTFVNESRANNQFFANLNRIYSSGSLCDVELVATGTSSQAESEMNNHISVHAHRVVLAASSSYFNAMFTTAMKEANMNVIHMKEVDGGALRALVQYMYSGSLDIDENNVQSILSVATMLGMTCARDASSRFMLERLDVSNCVGMAVFAEQQGCPQLAHAAHVFCQQHFRELVSSDELLSLDEEHLLRLVTDDRLTTNGEQSVYEAVINWFRHDPSSRAPSLPTLLAEVRLPQLPADFILSTIYSDPVVMNDQRCKDLLLQAHCYDLRQRLNWREDVELPPSVSVMSKWERKRTPIPMSKLIMLIGGQAPKAVCNVDTFDFDSFCFSSLRPLSHRLCRCGVATLGSEVYVVGGFNGSQRVKTVEVYSPEIDAWRMGVPMEQRRSTLGVAVLEEQGLMVAVGGFDGSTGLSSAEAYDTRMGRWSALPSMAVRRSSVAVASVGDSIYAIGGYDGYARQCLSSVEIYDARANKWRFGPSLNHVRSGAAVAVMADKTVVAIGGHDGPVVRKSVEALREDIGWDLLPDMSTGRRNASVVSIGSSIVAIGGDDGQINLDSMEYLSKDAKDLEWMPIPVSLPQGRSYCGIALLTRHT